MKKFKYIAGIFFIAFLFGVMGFAQAQNEDTGFRLIKFNKGDQILTLVSGEELELKLDEAYTGDNALAQYFIVRRLENHNAYIAAASNRDLMLQRNEDGTVVLAKYNEDNAADYEWRVDYAGFPYCAISSPESGKFVMTLGDDGVLKMAEITALENNDSPDNFRFGLVKSDKAIF